MKKFLLVFCLIFTVSMAFSQIILEENFDSFSNGDKIAAVSGTSWTTWSNSPGGSEDGTISNAYALSASNSLHLANNNDVVLLLNGLTTGRYKINFEILIETGRIGYFNVLQDFQGGSSEWGTQIYFNPSGQGSVDAGSASAATFSYNYDTWIPVSIIIDLDEDFASVSLDNNHLVSWIWSTGTFGSGNLNQLDAVNFYGTTVGGTSSMYIDDLVFSKIEAPEIPSSINAVLSADDRDVILTWTATSSAPLSYTVYREDELVADGITTTSYTDLNIYPGVANYYVRARFSDLGDSGKSNTATVERPGGGQRELVLFEVGTGTGCPNCPAAARGVSDMVEFGDNVAILEYHNYNSNDPFNCEDAASRTQYYNITGYPTEYHDGAVGVVGGSYGGNLYSSYHNFYTARSKKLALYDIDVDIEFVSQTDYIAHITLNENSQYYGDLSKVVRVALTETNIDYAWQGLSEVHFAVREMFPNAAGTSVDFTTGTTQTLDIPFSLDESWVKDNCELVVFLQSDDNKEVLQTNKTDMVYVVSSVIDNSNVLDVKIYPNPVRNSILTNIEGTFDYSIYTITGQQIVSGTSTQSIIDLQSLKTGIYFLNISTEKGTVQKKFIKE